MNQHKALSFGIGIVAVLALSLVGGQVARCAASDYEITAASYIGGLGDDDAVMGCAIQSNGVVVLAVNMTYTVTRRPVATDPPPIKVDTPGGFIVRLSPDGRKVLSARRIGVMALDVAVDANDNIYAAAWTDGAIKLDRRAENVLWTKQETNAQRIDAGPAGFCAVLGGAGDPEDEGYEVRIYDPNGEALGSISGGKWKFDVCIDETSQTVIYTGFRNAHTSGNPVQIAYLQGVGYDGQIKYTCYDWSADESSPRWLNRPTNNMADTRGYRCSIGRDGKLYCAFECAGGNHMFRYSPFDIMQKVSIVGGDAWHEFYNTKSEHKTFFARYEPGTGEYLLGQQFCCRLTNGRGNTARIEGGQIVADELGRVYLGGTSAWGLPIPGHPNYKPSEDEAAFNPFPEGYLGGAYLLVMSADFRTRLYCTRLTSEKTRAIAARVLSGDAAQIAFGGVTEGEMFLDEPIGATFQGAQAGWFAVISHYLAGDINRDGFVDAADLKDLGEQWLARPSEASADVAPPGGDDFVDLKDFAVVGTDWRHVAVAAPTPTQPGSRPIR